MKTGMSGPASRKTGGRPSPGGRGRGNKPPSHCLTYEGIYTNARMVHVLTSMVGSRCELHVKNGRTYDGIFKTFSPQLQLVLDAVHQKQEGAEGGLGGEAILPAVIFQRTDVVTVHFPNVDLSFASRDGSTEGAKVNGEHRERELQPWQGGDGELGELESDTSNGWDATEMFRCNEEVYGVKSTYDDSLSSYTTPLQSDASEDYQRRAARASQLALEMEAGSEKGEKAEEGTEEDRHAAVIRPLNLEPSTPSPPPATRVAAAAAAAAAAGTGSGTRSGSNAETGVGPSVANTAGVATSPVAGTGTVSVRSERSYRTKFGNDGSEESRERTYIHRDVKYSSQPRHMRGGLRGAPGGRGGGRGGSGGPNTSPSSSPRGSPYHPHSHNTPPPHHQVYHPTESAGSPVVNGALTPSCSAPPSRPPFPPRTHPSPSNLTPNPSRSTNRLPFSHSQPQAPPSQGRRGGGMEVPRMSPKSQRPSRPPRPPGHPSSGGRVVGVGVTGGRGTPPVGDGAHNSSPQAGTALPAEVSPQGAARMGSWSAVVSSAPSQTSPKHTTPSAPASTTPQPSSSQHYHPSNQPAPLSHAGTQSPVYSRTAGPGESGGSVLKDEPALLPPGGEGKVPIPSQTAQAPPSVEAERSQDVRELKEFCNKFTLQSSTPKEPQLPPADPVPQPQRPSPTPPAPTAGPIAESQGEGMEGEGETVVDQVRKSTLNPNAREFNPHCKAFHPTAPSTRPTRQASPSFVFPGGIYPSSPSFLHYPTIQSAAMYNYQAATSSQGKAYRTATTPRGEPAPPPPPPPAPTHVVMTSPNTATHSLLPSTPYHSYFPYQPQIMQLYTPMVPGARVIPPTHPQPTLLPHSPQSYAPPSENNPNAGLYMPGTPLPPPHPPPPSATPTGQIPRQHPAQSPAQAIYHGTLTPTPPGAGGSAPNPQATHAYATAGGVFTLPHLPPLGHHYQTGTHQHAALNPSPHPHTAHTGPSPLVLVPSSQPVHHPAAVPPPQFYLAPAPPVSQHAHQQQMGFHTHN